MGFPRQEYWSGMPFPSPGNLPNPGVEHMSLVLAGGFFTTEPPGIPIILIPTLKKDITSKKTIDQCLSHRCKNLQQNINKSSETIYKKSYTSRPRGI